MTEPTNLRVPIVPLTKDELDKVLAPTSPHSFKHNVSLLCASNGFESRSEPVTKIPDNIFHAESMIDVISELDHLLSIKNGMDGSSTETLTVRVATVLATLSIEIRSVAAVLGIPLEDVQDALIGASLFKPSSPISEEERWKIGVSAVASMLYGVRKPRHPYENIKDE